MRDTNATIQWYRDNETWPGEIGFDPDGMCLKICRTARGIPAMFPSAVSAQEATPGAHRVTKVSELKRGMVIYYDDPNDSNPFGHIVTMVGRVKGGDKDSLRDILVRTNSVKSNQIVVTRGDYFPKHWGDSFKFGATWLNGQVLDLGQAKPEPKPDGPPLKSARNLRQAIDALRQAVQWHREQGNDRLVRALQRDIEAIQQTIRKFS